MISALVYTTCGPLLAPLASLTLLQSAPPRRGLADAKIEFCTREQAAILRLGLLARDLEAGVPTGNGLLLVIAALVFHKVGASVLWARSHRWQ